MATGPVAAENLAASTCHSPGALCHSSGDLGLGGRKDVLLELMGEADVKI